MTKRNLLICFDAFGTLFKPKRPIEEQYTAVAHQLGVGVHLGPDGTRHLPSFGPAEVRASFRRAFKDCSKKYPNYGRAVGMGASAWWTKVIHDTFTPLLPPSQRGKPQALPPELAPALIHRFSSAEGYQEPSPGLRILFRRLRSISSEIINNIPHQQQKASVSVNQSTATAHLNRLIVGVITNSDDRVPGILSSFGLRVNPLRYDGMDHSVNSPTSTSTSDIKGKEEGPMTSSADTDIDFHCMSYDVGYEKPDRRIFEAAEELAGLVMDSSIVTTRTLEAAAVEGHAATGNSSSSGGAESGSSIKVFVGDEYRHDVLGALGADWIPVWIPEMADGHHHHVHRNEDDADPMLDEEIEMVCLDESSIGHLKWGDVFGDESATGCQGLKKIVVQCSSLEVLVDWLVAVSRGQIR